MKGVQQTTSATSTAGGIDTIDYTETANYLLYLTV